MATLRDAARVAATVAARGLALACVLTVACSGGDKIVAPGATNGGNTALVRADSLYMASQMTVAASQAIKTLRQIQTPDLPFVGASAPKCAPATTTGGTDTNNNGVPDDRTLQYTTATCTQTSAGTTSTLSGSVRTQDLGELYAFRVTYTNLVAIATKGDSTVKSTINGTFEYRWTSASAASGLDNSTLVLEVRSGAGSQSVTRVANLSTQFSPTGGSTIVAGRALPAGSMTVTGTVAVSVLATGNAVVAGTPPSATLGMGVSTSVPLTMAASCNAEPVFNVGTLNGTVTGSAIGAVSVRFVGCGGIPSKS